MSLSDFRLLDRVVSTVIRFHMIPRAVMTLQGLDKDLCQTFSLVRGYIIIPAIKY